MLRSRSRYHRVLRPRRLAKTAPLWLAVLFFVGGSTRIGYQDVGALIARQTATERVRERIANAPMSLHLATFSLPRPVGTAIPTLDAKRLAKLESPSGVNRAPKGDLQVPRIQIQILSELLREDAQDAAPDDAQNLEASLDFVPFARFDPAMTLDPNEHVNNDLVAGNSSETEIDTALYFDPRGAYPTIAGIEPWPEGDVPHLEGQPVQLAALPAAPSAVLPEAESKPVILAQPPVGPADLARALQTPADRLKLTEKTRTKAEKCLATAIYFEARSEPVRGQVAVAQVIINRAFSGYYPEDICGVVYQNAHRHLSCQFTFACDGIPDVVTEPEHWARAQRIATASLDGKIWLDDVGLATHYHASYVYPYWVRSMRKLKKIGLHTFYRPRKWGEDNVPTWTPAAAELVAKM